MKQRRVVCAANQQTGGFLILGPRHWDDVMHDTFNRLDPTTQCTINQCRGHEVQGFIDQWGVFMTREEAWKVAEAAGQILYRCGGDTRNGGTLYSENLY